jgi:hypothetical protein
MLRIFPIPRCQSFPLSCEVFGDAIIAKDEDAPRASTSKPGRPPRGYSIKTAIQNWFKATLKAKPDYARAPRETMVQDAIHFAETFLGEEVARATVQSYLSPILPPMPEIPAGNLRRIAAG